MRARLIHNPRAGGAEHTAEELAGALRDALRRGFAGQPVEVVHGADFASKSIHAWIAESPVDLVVAAGGDGTIARAVRALAGSATPLAIVPLGTANNIARSLGLALDPTEVIAGLVAPVKRRLDLGIASGTWGERHFVEAAGVGLFQFILEYEVSSRDKNPRDARKVMLEKLLRGYAPRRWKFRVDGVEHDEELVLLEAMVMRSTGPRLRLAPSADPFDGVLDVVVARRSDVVELERYLRALLDGDEGATPDLETVRARHVHLELAGSSLRLDDGILPEEGPRPYAVDLRLAPSAVEVWLPAPRPR